MGRPPLNDTRNPRRLLEGVFAAALAAVDGRAAVARALTARPIAGPVWLCATGKAAESMALGAVDVLGERCVGGLAITKEGHLDAARLTRVGIDGLVGGHPVPSSASLVAGERLLTALGKVPSGVTLLFLISGGASSLVEVPAGGLALADLQRLGRWLLGSGLPIDAMNLVRKSVSRIKGGGLLGALPDRPLRLLAISDVPGDDPGVIGSGLLVPEPGLAERVGRLDLPDWVHGWIARGIAERGALPSAGPDVELVATLSLAKSAAAEAAREMGAAVCVHPSFIDGDAAERGRELARRVAGGAPGLHIWGGETTVRLPPSPGRGGRNQHLALAAATEIAGRGDCWFLSAGTDGTDGNTEDTGALVDGGTLERAAVEGFDAEESLARADSGSLLAATGDLINTGPTGTNVMDLMLGLRC